MRILKIIGTILALLVGIVALTLGLFVLIQNIQEKIFIPDKYLVWIFKGPYNRLVFIFEFYLLGFCMINIKKIKYNPDAVAINTWFINKIKKYKKKFILLNIILIYVIMVNITVITNDKIIDYSILKPLGKDYSYEDVVKVKTGFYGVRIPFFTDKGEFYYIIELKDGSKVNLNDTLGGTYEELDTYEEIEIFDKDLMSLGVEKESSLKNIDKCDFDKIYIDRFKRIIDNK